jgi:TPR repeat protein
MRAGNSALDCRIAADFVRMGINGPGRRPPGLSQEGWQVNPTTSSQRHNLETAPDLRHGMKRGGVPWGGAMRGLISLRHRVLAGGVLLLAGCALPQQSPGPSDEQVRAQIRDGDYLAAAPDLQILADRGNPRAQVMLGAMYEAGHGVAQDFGEARRLYELAAAQDHAPAFGPLGRMYEMGRGGIQDLAKAVHLYERGIAAGDDWSAFFRAFQYETGEGAEHNMAEAVRLYRMAAEQEHTRAITRLGILHMRGIGVERDLTEARRLLEMAAPHSELARRMLAHVQ